MGALASYAGQIFNNYIGFSMSLLGGIMEGNIGFNIFALRDKGQSNEPDRELPVPYSAYYLMGVIVFVLISLVL